MVSYWADWLFGSLVFRVQNWGCAAGGDTVPDMRLGGLRGGDGAGQGLSGRALRVLGFVMRLGRVAHELVEDRDAEGERCQMRDSREWQQQFVSESTPLLKFVRDIQVDALKSAAIKCASLSSHESAINSYGCALCCEAINKMAEAVGKGEK